MLSFLPGPVKGALSFSLIVINTVFWSTLLFPIAFIKFANPIPAWRRFCGVALNGIATNWIMVNNWNLWLLHNIRWQVTGLEGLRMDQWYLVLSNHQSWSDILVLQKVFNRRVPFLKFFLKQELIWVPILGLAWWALDYPFMKRYSKEFLERRPELKGKDLETTRRACEKFRTMPVSIMNFVEGTRFTRAKHESQGSPYRFLLRPKAAGIAFVLGAMGEQLSGILNVTIVYPGGARDLWEFLCGKAAEVRVRVESLPVTPEILGDYFGDEQYRVRFQEWLNRLWEEKDAVYGALGS
jgi:1-acyl-sn-glycerol-3-phosphate acyltransferase